MSRILIYACGRSAQGGQPLPDGATHVELPCIGRVSTTLLLSDLAHGADGILVMGRHQATCRFNGAEDLAMSRVDTAVDLLKILGIESGRIQFVDPAAGPGGPLEAVEAFCAEIARLGDTPLSPTAALPAELFAREGLETSWSLAKWIARQPGITPGNAAWLERRSLPAAAPGKPALDVGHLPALDLLVGDLLRPVRLADLIAAALSVLARLGQAEIGVHVGQAATDSHRFTLCRRAPAGAAIDGLLMERGADLPRPRSPMTVAFDGDADRRALIVALGHAPLDLGPDPYPDRLCLSADERTIAARRLREAEAQQARALLVDGPLSLTRWGMITRQGAWRSSRIMPLLGVQLARESLDRFPTAPGDARVPTQQEVQR